MLSWNVTSGASQSQSKQTLVNNSALCALTIHIDAMSHPELHTVDGCGYSLCQTMDTRHYFMYSVFLLLPSPVWAEGTVLSLSVCLSVCLSAEFCCFNWHNSRTKSSVTVKLCKGMANDASME